MDTLTRCGALGKGTGRVGQVMAKEAQADRRAARRRHDHAALPVTTCSGRPDGADGDGGRARWSEDRRIAVQATAMTRLVPEEAS